MTVCTHCKARHWECERTKLTGHFSTCCSQGKVQLPPSGPIPTFNSYLKARIANARSYNNALSFTSLAAHVDQTRPGTQGPRMFWVFCRLVAFTIDSGTLGALIPAVNQRPTFAKTWLICPAEATDTQLGPDGADSRIQRSTLTRLESMLRTKNHFIRPCAPGRNRRTHNLPTSSTEMAMLICDSETNTGDRGPQDLILQVHGDRCPDGRPKYQGKMASTPTFLFAGFAKLGCQSPETESRSTMVSNRARYLPVSVLMTKAKRRTKTARMRMKTARKGTKRMVMANDEGQVKGSRWRVSRSQLFAHYLSNATSTSQSRIAPNVPSWKNLRLTTTQGINGLTPNQIGRSMTLGSTFQNRPRDITQRYQDAMACVVKHGKSPLLITMSHDPESPEIKAALGPNDKACNRPDLIA
ncbi:BZ3500_MvSof-1268-A1-R1_Chr1-3g01609 [Microbotryum saponariae]|uniref:BZ3500_MvSof-1268-A1-R1_Chr1-3g01609 protein n=1 Tax=Microbotryum saponariae TaxID=289078 RepID=A0A2X0KBU9_9BASI|nr:BZ3500_MvSof-1268-A1-R1_Chr1-3g01609 [Microbotryum saponariae]SCZ94131.1 BZ3501_MvSof-1269-A2-R1_Chr1-3g01210 [Microbotryum saponariae]